MAATLPAHRSITNTVTNVDVGVGNLRLEVINRGTVDVFLRWDGTDPGVETDGSFVVAATSSVLFDIHSVAGDVVVGFVASATTKISVGVV